MYVFVFEILTSLTQSVHKRQNLLRVNLFFAYNAFAYNVYL